MDIPPEFLELLDQDKDGKISFSDFLNFLHEYEKNNISKKAIHHAKKWRVKQNHVLLSLRQTAEGVFAPKGEVLDQLENETFVKLQSTLGSSEARQRERRFVMENTIFDDENLEL